MGIEEQFGGRGRAVITASSAMEYAFEGDELADTRELAPSVFTSALVEGLATGEADRDQDGLVALDELYDYVYDKVREATPNQTPGKWTFAVQGDLYIARRARPVTTPAPLPPELQDAIDHPLAAVRAGAAQELARLLQSRHAGLALAARLAMERLTEDDSRAVAGAATAALGAQPQPAAPEPVPPRLALSATVIDFGQLPGHSKPPDRRVRLGNAGGGILNARAATQASWLILRQVGDELVITTDTKAAGAHDGVVRVDSDGGSATIRVQARVDPAPSPAPEAAAITHPEAVPAAPEHDRLGPQQDAALPGVSPAPVPAPSAAAHPQVRPHRGLPRGYHQGDKLATWWQRVRAALIDLLPLVPGVILIQVGGSIVNKNVAAGQACIWIGLAVIAAISTYNRWHLQGTTGQSWGKRALGLKLIRMSGKEPVGRRRAFVRDLANLVDIIPLFGVGFLFPIWTVSRQTLPDMVVKTVVISQGKTARPIS